jgi:hypothetical protein
MSEDSPFLIREQTCDDAVVWMVEQMQQAGLKVMHTFDLQVARHDQIVCPCPHHGTDQCDCQLVVLLVYWENYTPITIIAHGYNHQTRFMIVDNPQQHAEPILEAFIRRVVEFPSLQARNIETQARTA